MFTLFAFHGLILDNDCNKNKNYETYFKSVWFEYTHHLMVNLIIVINGRNGRFSSDR